MPLPLQPGRTFTTGRKNAGLYPLVNRSQPRLPGATIEEAYAAGRPPAVPLAGLTRHLFTH